MKNYVEMTVNSGWYYFLFGGSGIVIVILELLKCFKKKKKKECGEQNYVIQINNEIGSEKNTDIHDYTLNVDEYIMGRKYSYLQDDFSTNEYYVHYLSVVDEKKRKGDYIKYE